MHDKINRNLNDNVLYIGGVPAYDLAEKYGTPLFVFDKKVIVDTCIAFKSALDKFYGKGIISYASKAFSAKGIYKIINENGLGCDVVSGGELYTALKAGFPAEKIIFHGNNKSFSELNFALDSGVGNIVIDSYDEASEINDLCIKKNIKANVSIRINPGIEAHTHHYVQTATISSKFGFSISNGDAEKIVKYVKSFTNLNLIGLHCHIGSQIFETKSFEIAVDKMTEFYAYLKEKFGYEFETLNMGGGFGIQYTDDDPDVSEKDYEEFIKLISEKVIQNVSKFGLKKPYLILEPGRSIVGRAGTTLYTVGTVKEIRGVKNYVAIDGGMFENPRYALYEAKYKAIAPLKLNEKPTKLYTIAGKCCESGDVIAENVLLPEMKKGDLLAVLSTGAYNYSMASNYNRNLIPPVVVVENGRSEYMIRPQTYEDLIRNDV